MLYYNFHVEPQNSAGKYLGPYSRALCSVLRVLLGTSGTCPGVPTNRTETRQGITIWSLEV